MKNKIISCTKKTIVFLVLWPFTSMILSSYIGGNRIAIKNNTNNVVSVMTIFLCNTKFYNIKPQEKAVLLYNCNNRYSTFKVILDNGKHFIFKDKVYLENIGALNFDFDFQTEFSLEKSMSRNELGIYRGVGLTN